jgi:hypothetical protein
MPFERAPMRKVREILRLEHALGASERQIAVSVGVSRSTTFILIPVRSIFIAFR